MKGNTSVSLGAHFEGFIAEQIAEGRYKNASEVIRDALRRLEDEEKERQRKIKWLLEAIREGEESGPPVEIDSEELLRKFKADRAARLGRDGEC